METKTHKAGAAHVASDTWTGKLKELKHHLSDRHTFPPGPSGQKDPLVKAHAGIHAGKTVKPLTHATTPRSPNGAAKKSVARPKATTKKTAPADTGPLNVGDLLLGDYVRVKETKTVERVLAFTKTGAKLAPLGFTAKNHTVPFEEFTRVGPKLAKGEKVGAVRDFLGLGVSHPSEASGPIQSQDFGSVYVNGGWVKVGDTVSVPHTSWDPKKKTEVKKTVSGPIGWVCVPGGIAFGPGKAHDGEWMALKESDPVLIRIDHSFGVVARPSEVTKGGRK